ncbi:MAG: class I SAM-dependent methyltransferase [Candidatus Acidiferrales bacterium]
MTGRPRREGKPDESDRVPAQKPGRAVARIGELHERLVSPRRIAVLAECLAALLPHDCRLLDVGCGDGALGALLERTVPGLRITGVEVLPRAECAIECHAFDGERLPFADRSFDGCLFVDVLHHTRDPFAILEDACRVSRNFILIKDHLAETRWDHWRLRFMDWVGNRPHDVVLPYAYLSRAKWRDLFDQLNVTEERRNHDLPLYPAPASWVFGGGLHFAAFLRTSSK